MSTIKINTDLNTKPAENAFSKMKKDFTKPIKPEIKLKDVGGIIGKFGKQLDRLSIKRLHKDFDNLDKKGNNIAKRFIGKLGKGITKTLDYPIESFKKAEMTKSFQTGMGAAQSQFSDLAQTTGGGFSSTVSNQLKFVKSVKDGAKEMYGNWKESRAQREAEKRESFDKKMVSTDQAYKGGGEQGTSVGGTTKGGMLQSVGSGIMVLEGIAKAAGFAMQMASTMGEKHIQAVMSESSTIGATGGYVGGGGGYFANPQIAQGQIAMNRALGEYGNKGIAKDKEFKAFKAYASEQNMGFAEFADSVGEFKRVVPDIKMAFIRGAALQTGMKGLKQGEFIKELSSKIKGIREQGFGDMDIKKFSEFTAGIGEAFKGAGLSPERAMKVSGQMDLSARKAEKGGIVGQLALAQKLGEGMDYFEAVKSLEGGGYGKETHKFLQETLGSKEIAGTILRQEGISSQREGEAVFESGFKPIKESKDSFKSVENLGISLQNSLNQAFATNKGAIAAAETAAKMQEEQLKLMNQFSGEIKKISEFIGSAEEKVFKMIGGAGNMIKSSLGAIEEMGGKIGDLITAINNLINKLK